MRKRSGIAAGIAGLAVAVNLLTDCSQPVGTGSRTSVTRSDSAASTSSPQIGGPAVSGNASLNGPSVVSAGSFPRSILITGTDTSIRIGGY
jgi:hypothetical protein